MNKRTFIKTLGIGSVAAVTAPLSLFAETPEVQKDFELIEWSYVHTPVKFMGHEWYPAYKSLDWYKDLQSHTFNSYTLIIRYQDPLPVSGLVNCRLWQVTDIFFREEERSRVPTKEQWNGTLLFDSFFHTPERELLNKNHPYVALVILEK